MNLPNPVQLTIPGNNRLHTFAELPLTLIDEERLKRVQARLRTFPRLLTLWEGAAYDAAGDYTQAQAEARVLELLGPDIKAGLERLFNK